MNNLELCPHCLKSYTKKEEPLLTTKEELLSFSKVLYGQCKAIISDDTRRKAFKEIRESRDEFEIDADLEQFKSKLLKVQTTLSTYL